MPAAQAVVPACREAWADLVDRDPDGLVTQTPGWVDAVTDVMGGVDASRFYTFTDGTSALLPMVRRGAGRVSMLESMPFAWGFGGLLTCAPPTTAMVVAVLQDLRADVAVRIHLRPNPLHAETWSAAAAVLGGQLTVVPRVAHVLSLSGGYDEVWQHRFTSNTRRHVRLAEKAGVEVEMDATGRLIPEFYNLYLNSLDRWASRQHEPRFLARWRGSRRDPVSKFEAISRHVGRQAQIWLARYEGRPAAAIIVLEGRNAHCTRSVMDEELVGPSHATNLLHSMAIQHACQSGCNYYHLGETGTSEGLARFKERLGAARYNYAEYRLERLPITETDQMLRNTVKRVIKFRD